MLNFWELIPDHLGNMNLKFPRSSFTESSEPIPGTEFS